MASGNNDEVRVEPVTSADDFPALFACTCATFGRQTNDGVWQANNPGWDTPEGAAAGAARMADRWRSATRDSQGRPNTVFLKAVAGGGSIAGFAIFVQQSVVPGFGDAPVEDLARAADLEALYPGRPDEQRYLCQADYSLHRRRIEAVKAKRGGDPPATFALDMCVVDPAFQRRGIAARLVQWGLDEAERRGGLECLTEASPMGRTVYAKLGFKQDGGELEHLVDDEFKDRRWPSNVFMRTGTQS